jgi:ribonuclease R
MTQYCCAHVGEEFDGIVSSVCSFGIFVRTDKLFEGLIPVENLFSRRDTAVYNESTMTLKAGSRIYRLGDPIRIRVTRAEVATGRIDMELAEPILRENSFDGENRRRPRGGDRRPSSDKRGGSGKRTSYGDRRGKRGQPERRGQGKHTSHGGHRRGKK